MHRHSVSKTRVNALMALRRIRETLSVVALCFIEFCALASAQDYPTRPIHALTAVSAGGTSDIFMRAMSQEFGIRWKQTIVVEDRPGGSMNIGGEACAQAQNDGYTICILPPETLAYNQLLFKALRYDPQRDFAPITNPFFTTQVLVVSAKLGVHSLTELAALSKSRPKTLSYTAPSIPLVAFMEQWIKANKADIVKVPFRGGGEAVNDMLSGSTPVAFFGASNWLSFIKNGTVIPLAVDSPKRSPLSARRADARRAWLSRRSHPALFRLGRTGGNAAADRPKALQPVRRRRRRSGVSAKADDRRRTRAGIQHP